MEIRKQGNSIARAILNASDMDLGAFSQEVARAMEMGRGGASFMEEALITTSEAVFQPHGRRRGEWTMMSGLWRWPEEHRLNGTILPEIYTVAQSESPDTDGRRLEPEEVDWIGSGERLLMEVALLSSRAACDAWAACFLMIGAGEGPRGATRCLTPDGWVSVTWQKDTKSCLMYLDRSYPDSPVIKSILDEDGTSLVRTDFTLVNLP